MQKTKKSALIIEIEKRTVMTDPMGVDIIIIDGLFFLYFLWEPPSTLGLISRYILTRVCGIGTFRIHLVFDRIMTPSIEDYERRTRAYGQDYLEIIKFLDQPKNDQKISMWHFWIKDFKISLSKFLVDSWQEDFAVEIIKDNITFVTYEEKCFSCVAIHET